MKIELPDDLIERKKLTEQDLKEILLVSLYKLEKINGVEGAKALGISEIEFHGVVAKYGQYVNYDIDDLENDMDNLKDF